MGLVQRRSPWLVLGLLILVASSQLNGISKYGRYNLGWLALSRAYYTTEQDTPGPARATELLTAAADAPGRRASLGIGLAEALQSRPEAAFQAWSAGGIDAAHLLSLGAVYESRNMPSQALTLYRGADTILQQPENGGIIRANALCRRLRLELSLLYASGQSVCRDFFAGNQWILNGQFINSNLEGWLAYGGRDPAFVSYRADLALGHPSPSLAIRRINLPLGEENGIYQHMLMQPGERVQFSAWFRAEAEQAFDTRLLYIEWVDLQGRGAGNHGAELSKSTDWIYFEREFELVSKTPQSVRFFPALLTGSATLWVDHVQLELLAEQR